MVRQKIFLIVGLVVLAILLAGVFVANRFDFINLKNLIDSKDEKQVSIVSEVPAVIVSFDDQSYLLTKLNELGFWDGEKRNYDNNQTVFVQINHLNIVITTQEQKINRVVKADSNPPDVYQSTGLVIDPGQGTATMYLHLDQEFIDRLSEENLNKVYSMMIMRRAYGVKNKVDTNQDNDYADKTESFLKVEKK